MNVFTAILAFATICAIPMCYAVPCLSSPLSVVSGPTLVSDGNLLGGWNGLWNGGLYDGCLSPATSCALNGHLTCPPCPPCPPYPCKDSIHSSKIIIPDC